MALTPDQIRELSRLLDQALELPPAQRSGWIDQLPPQAQPLLPSLRRMLAQGPDTPALSTAPPRLHDLPADDDDAGQPGQHVGPYRLLRVVGRGGMGAVWLAERADGIFQREVAVKLPRMASRHRLSERMARERQIGARLEHPHIARLYDAGIDDRGRPYLVMEYVQGSDLLEHCELRLLDLRARLRLLLQACAAVAHAHRHLVIHRDIKPSNLLVSLDGTLKLLDFGIATLLDDEAPDGGGSTASNDSQRVLTPRYAAPEQVAGTAASTATDIYALGVVAHELLTGAVPPAAPDGQRQVDPVLGTDLQAVLQRALQPQPASRYSSVDRLADDLQRVLDHRPVAAAPGTTWHRARLWARRHRPQLAAASLVLLVMVGATTLLVRQQLREWAEAERSAQARAFVFAVLEDTLPMAGQQASDINGAHIVANAIDRARRGFVGQPALRGEVLLQLALLQRRLQPGPQALQLLRESQQLLQQHADADDAVLQTTRAQLAVELLQRPPAPLDEVERLANQALQRCQRDTVACAQARAFAHHAQKELARQRGDLQGAVNHARKMVDSLQRAYGSEHAETVMGQLDLGVVLRNAGALLEAEAVLQKLRPLAGRAHLRAVDALEIQVVETAVLVDLGRLDAAQASLGTLIEDPSAATQAPTLWRLLALVQLEQGQPEAAWESADRGWQAARDQRDTWHEAMARQTRARAAMLLGRFADAVSDLHGVADWMVAAGLEEDSVEQLRLSRLQAEADLSRGAWVRAAERLAALPARHRVGSAGVRAPVDLAQVLILSGGLASANGQHDRAAVLLRQAGELLALALPSDHPLRLRHAIAEAHAAAMRTGGRDSGRLAQAVGQFLARQPTGSVWHGRLDGLVRNPAAGIPGVL